MAMFKVRTFKKIVKAGETVRVESSESEAGARSREANRLVPELEREMKEFLSIADIVPGSLLMTHASTISGGKFVTEIIIVYQEVPPKDPVAIKSPKPIEA